MQYARAETLLARMHQADHENEGLHAPQASRVPGSQACTLPGPVCQTPLEVLLHQLC